MDFKLILIVIIKITLINNCFCEVTKDELVKYTIKQYTKLLETIKLGIEYPMYGNPLEPKWQSRGQTDHAIFEEAALPGILWYLYKYTNDSKWKDYAIRATDGLYGSRNVNGSHDIGFVIIESYDNGYQFSHNKTYLPVIQLAAETLATRFNKNVGCTRSWNAVNPEDFIVIADNMMNLELLLRGWQITGNKTYYDMAVSHTNRTIREHIRADYSSFQVVEFNSTTGAVIRKRTQQGWSDTSCWARGQAWLIAGLTITYRFTKLDYILNAAENVAQYFIEHLPEDNVPNFDFTVPKNALKHIPKDTSSAAIASSGFLELHHFTNKTIYKTMALKMINSLYTNYRADGKPEYKLPALLVNGTHYYKNNFDKAMSYGDYHLVKSLQWL